jgi:hypothetical protein
MAEEETKVTIDVWGTKKPEGTVDQAKATKDQAAPPAAEGEVEGHWWHGGHFHHHWHGGGRFWVGGGGGGWTRCWNCGSVRFVANAYPGQVFICGNCGSPYTPY